MSQAQQHPTWENASVEEKKNDIAENEYTQERSNIVTITPEEDNAVRRKFNRRVLPTLIWVYFLQIADKYILGLAAVWGLQKDAGLHGTQYSTMASMNAIAQLIWLPFSSYLLVRVPNREYMAVLVVGWGAALMGMGFSHSFGALCATRFLVGLFEAACLPLFAMITAQYWKRSEQTLIVACWYGTNGIATMVCSLMSFGIGHVHSPHIKSWQLVFILPACLTILTGPIVYFTIPNSIADSKFLDEREKEVALERVRLNKTGTGSKEYKASHLKEAAWDPKTWMLIATSVFLNAGANVTGTFGGLLIKGLGFNNFITSLLNMPFGAVQFLVIILFAWLATRFKYKGPFLAAMCIPVIIGTVILFVSGRHKSDNPKNLVGYYLLGFIFAGNPLIVSWAIANTGGSTKKAVVLVIYNIGSSIGNIIGPFLFKAKDSPYYRPGLRLVLILFIALFGIVIAQMFWFTLLNKRNRSRRVALGLPEHLVDHSMMSASEEKAAGHIDVEEDGDTEDTPDLQNPKFIYVL